MLLLSLSSPCTCLQYEGGEPCSICGHVMLPPGTSPHESCMPATIISGTLYLGNYDTASRQDLLKAMGITHVLNVSCVYMLLCTAGSQQAMQDRPAQIQQQVSTDAAVARLGRPIRLCLLMLGTLVAHFWVPDRP